MGIIKKILLLIILIAVGCKKHEQTKQTDKYSINIQSTDSQEIKQKTLKVQDTIEVKTHVDCFDFLKVLTNDENVFYFNDFNIALCFNIDKQENTLQYESEEKVYEYVLSDDFDLGEFSIWVYRLNTIHIYLLELDDYHESLFYVYMKDGKDLIKIGNISVTQKNVEIDGLKEESFKICKSGNYIYLESYLDEKKQAEYDMVVDSSNRIIPVDVLKENSCFAKF